MQMSNENMEALVQRALKETQNAFKQHGTYDRCECNLNFERNSQLATDGMKVALVLSIQAFYNAVGDKLPPKVCREAFDEFYDCLKNSINSVGKVTDHQSREAELVEQMDLMIYHTNEALRRMGIPKERFKKYI